MKATFGAGCFWCIEACFKDIDGVSSVTPGYAGGTKATAFYKEVCTGRTGHAEVAQIEFDAGVVSFERLLEMFWFVHDPTQLNRQGNDIGPQYRSVIFYHTDEQRDISESFKKRLNEEKVWDREVVTQLTPLFEFYPAEKEHKNYFENNPGNGYCQAIVRPKVEKFKKVFAKEMK